MKIINTFKIWRFKRRALAEVACQIAREKDNPDESFKACIYALYQMQELVTQFPSQATFTVYRNKLLQAMQHFKDHFESEFTDNYASARATLGSVINRLKSTIKE
ncbi:MAG TPA: hypothetical protein ENJ44_06250 [Oceanospirillales bacterium]|nr:hypothetical protein [Oceanospirillales bacterium]